MNDRAKSEQHITQLEIALDSICLLAVWALTNADGKLEERERKQHWKARVERGCPTRAGWEYKGPAELALLWLSASKEGVGHRMIGM